MAIAITQHTDSLFKIDGVPYAKVYEVEISSEKVNLKNTGNRKTVRLGNFKNITIDGASYTDIIEFRDTLSAFVFKKGGGNGEGLQAYDVSEEYKEDAVIIKDDKIYIANDLIPANTPFAIGTTGATWREISEGSNFWEATSTDSTTAYIYKGGLNGTDWQINRYDRADNLAKTSATVSNNSGITTLATAWADRLTINYV